MCPSWISDSNLQPSSHKSIALWLSYWCSLEKEDKRSLPWRRKQQRTHIHLSAASSVDSRLFVFAASCLSVSASPFLRQVRLSLKTKRRISINTIRTCGFQAFRIHRLQTINTLWTELIEIKYLASQKFFLSQEMQSNASSSYGNICTISFVTLLFVVIIFHYIFQFTWNQSLQYDKICNNLIISTNLKHR